MAIVPMNRASCGLWARVRHWSTIESVVTGTSLKSMKVCSWYELGLTSTMGIFITTVLPDGFFLIEGGCPNKG